MAIRGEVRIILILVVLVLILAAAIDFIKRNVEKADATKFVTEDLNAKYPGADLAIISTTEKLNDEGKKYYEIKTKVTKNANIACPERTHIYYNYPEQNFVPQPPDHITQNCQVCTEKACVLVFPEEAIIASHTLPGTEKVSDYLNSSERVSPTIEETDNGWKVVWDSPVANSVYEVTLSRNGSVLSVAKKAKTI